MRGRPWTRAAESDAQGCQDQDQGQQNKQGVEKHHPVRAHVVVRLHQAKGFRPHGVHRNPAPYRLVSVFWVYTPYPPGSAPVQGRNRNTKSSTTTTTGATHPEHRAGAQPDGARRMGIVDGRRFRSWAVGQGSSPGPRATGRAAAGRKAAPGEGLCPVRPAGEGAEHGPSPADVPRARTGPRSLRGWVRRTPRLPAPPVLSRSRTPLRSLPTSRSFCPGDSCQVIVGQSGSHFSFIGPVSRAPLAFT